MRTLVAIVAAAALLSAGTPISAAPAPIAAPSGAIYATDGYYPGVGSVAVPADGTPSTPACQGHPSYVQPRLFLTTVDGALMVSDSTCVPSTLLAEDGLIVSMAQWSFDDAKIAMIAYPRDTLPAAEVGVYVLAVGRSGTGVVATGAPNLVATLPPGTSPPSWAPDGQRIVVASPNPAHKTKAADPDSAAINDIYVVSLAGQVANLTNTPDILEMSPAWSPAGDRIAFVRTTVTKGPVRSDVFTTLATGGGQVQITNKSNTPSGSQRLPVWSPDAKHLAFACMPNALGAGHHVCRIDAAGRTKAVDLTPKTAANFSPFGWR